MTVIRNVLWMNADQAARALTDLGIAVIVARLVTTELYGQYQLMLSLFMVASIAALSGFNGVLLRALAKSYDGTLREIVRLSWRWSLVGSVVLVVVGVYWLLTLSRVVGLGVMLAAVVMPFFHVLRRWQVVLHAKEQFRLRAKYNIVASLVLFLTVVGAAYLVPDNVAVIFLTYVAVSALWHAFLYDRSQRWLTNDRVEEGWRASGYKLLASEVFGVLYAHLDKLALALWLGVEGLAIYAVAIMFGEALKLFFGNIVAVYLPKLHRGDTAKLYAWLRQRWAMLGGATIVGMTVLWVITPWLMVGLFSDKYANSVHFAQWYLLIVPFHMLASVFGYTLIKEKKELTYMKSMVTAGVVNILLYLLLIPKIGIYGAVAGSVGYYAVMMVLLYRGVVKLPTFSLR